MPYLQLALDDVWVEYYYDGVDDIAWWGSEYGYNDLDLVDGFTGNRITIESGYHGDIFVAGSIGYVRIEQPLIGDITVPPLFTTFGSKEVDFTDPRNVIFVMRIGDQLLFRGGRGWDYEMWAFSGTDRGRVAFDYSGLTKVNISTIAGGGGEDSGSVVLSRTKYSDYARVMGVKLTGDNVSSGTELYFYSDVGMTNLVYSQTGLDVFTSSFVDNSGFGIKYLDDEPTVLYWKIINNGGGGEDSAYELELFGQVGEDY
jgi:hypothetical protein